MRKQVKTNRAARPSRIVEMRKISAVILRGSSEKKHTISRTEESKTVCSKGTIRVYTSQQIIELKRIVQSVNSTRK